MTVAGGGVWRSVVEAPPAGGWRPVVTDPDGRRYAPPRPRPSPALAAAAGARIIAERSAAAAGGGRRVSRRRKHRRRMRTGAGRATPRRRREPLDWRERLVRRGFEGAERLALSGGLLARIDDDPSTPGVWVAHTCSPCQAASVAEDAAAAAADGARVIIAPVADIAQDWSSISGIHPPLTWTHIDRRQPGPLGSTMTEWVMAFCQMSLIHRWVTGTTAPGDPPCPIPPPPG